MAAGEIGARTPAALRRFGLELGGAFCVFAAISWWRGHVIPPTVMGIVGVTLLVLGLVVPVALGPVERGWMRFAELLARVMNPLVMGLAYFVLITPIGSLVRLRRDPLDRRMRDGRPSNWIRRERKPVDPARYRHQF